jgi:hypothetical protein
MKKIKNFYLIISLLLSLTGFGQDKIDVSNRKDKPNNFSLCLALQHTEVFDKFYAPIDTSMKFSPNSQPGVKVGRTYINQFGFRAGFNYEYFITNKLSIETGILVNQIRFKTVCSADITERNIANNLNLLHSFPLDNLKKSIYKITSFEIPFSIGYSYHRFSGYFGTIFTLINYSNERNTYIDNYIQRNHSHEFFFNDFWDVGDIIHFSLKVKYLMLQSKYPIWLSFATDRRNDGYVFQLGGQIRIMNFK